MQHGKVVEKNLKWRQTAAKEKLNTLVKQSNILEAKYLIPFASFIYFSDHYNFYLNDSINTPNKVLEIKNNIKSNILFLKPYEKIQIENNDLNTEGYNFWNQEYNKIKEKKPNDLNGYTCYEFET